MRAEPFTDEFDEFQHAYPVSRRVGGKLARNAFRRALCGSIPGLGPKEGQLMRMFAALAQHKRSEQWQDPKLIPLMTTWLNQERWLQVLPEPATSSRRLSTCPHEPQCASATGCTRRIIADGRRDRGEADAEWSA